MTRITDEAVEAGVAAALERNYGGLTADDTTQALMRDDIRVALEAALPHLEGATPAVDPHKAAGAAVAAIVYNLPVDGFGDERRLKDYARIWGNAAAKAVLALIGGAS